MGITMIGDSDGIIGDKSLLTSFQTTSTRASVINSG